MAADLAADLKEAEADGVSPEEVLGSGAFDPRSFAAAWAAERGVSRPSPGRQRVPRRSFILAAIAAPVALRLGIGAGDPPTSPSWLRVGHPAGLARRRLRRRRPRDRLGLADRGPRG